MLGGGGGGGGGGGVRGGGGGGGGGTCFIVFTIPCATGCPTPKSFFG